MGAAIRTAWQVADAAYVGLHPGDNQFDPRDLVHMLEIIGNCDIVIGVRESYNPGGWRLFLSRLQEQATTSLLGNRFRNMSGVNLYRTDLLARLDPRLDSCWLNIELIIKAQWLRLRLQTVPVHVRPRKSGATAVGRWRSQLVLVLEFFRLLAVLFGEARWRKCRWP